MGFFPESARVCGSADPVRLVRARRAGCGRYDALSALPFVSLGILDEPVSIEYQARLPCELG